mmetsp:Transcript_70670/g.132266  ORF Transcript_70670/g.132266 Transcript_70670/m.132266 type:complete len:264 (-) Transcript_70670:119-910(-)
MSWGPGIEPPHGATLPDFNEILWPPPRERAWQPLGRLHSDATASSQAAWPVPVPPAQPPQKHHHQRSARVLPPASASLAHLRGHLDSGREQASAPSHEQLSETMKIRDMLLERAGRLQGHLDKAAADCEAHMARSQRLTSTMKEHAEEEEMLRKELDSLDAEHAKLTTELDTYGETQEVAARGVRTRGLSADLRAENDALKKALSELHSDSSKEEEAATLAREINLLGVLLQRFGADLVEMAEVGNSLECQRQELAGGLTSHR